MNFFHVCVVPTTSPTKVVGTIEEIFISAIIVGTDVPTMIIVTAVPTRIVAPV